MGPSRFRQRRRVRQIDLRKALFVLPNLVTLASIYCGFTAIQVVATDNPTVADFHRAAILLMFAMLFDLLDGRIARMTRTQSAFGLQLDSLADVISFGIAPSLLMYKWTLFRLPGGAFIAFLFTAAGAVRLARFNVISSTETGAPVKPGKYILGLPIPPSAGVLVSLLLANYAVEGALGDEKYAVSVAAATIVLSLLMVSSVKFRSFKDLKFNWATTVMVLFAISSSALVWRYSKPHFVLLWLLSFYVLIAVFEAIRAFAQSLRRTDSDPASNSDAPGG